MSNYIYIFLIFFINIYFSNGHGGELERQTLVMSFDGFRWDYVDRIRRLKKDSHIWRLIENGAYAPKGITTLFTTITFPNHYSLVTGLYQESHGVISNTIYDPILNRTSNLRAGHDEWVYGGEPIWKTLIKQAHMHEKDEIVGCSMWIACQFGKFKNFRPFAENVAWETRVDEAVGWLEHESTKLVLLYHDEPDHTGHENGTNSQAMDQTLLLIDSMVGTLVDKLVQKELFGEINLLIVSDHGMMDAVDWDSPVMPEQLPKDLFIVRMEQPSQWLVEPLPGRMEETIAYFKKFPHTHVIQKPDIPEHWHYKHSERIMPLLVMAEPGYSLNSRMKGYHGYNNSLMEMRPTFIAHGPAFVSNSTVPEEMSIVDVYLLLCTILDLKPAPNNGTASHFKNFVQIAFLGEQGEELFSHVPFVTLLVSISIILFALFMVLCYRCRKAAHQKRIQDGGRLGEKNHLLYRPLPMESLGPLLTTSAINVEFDDSDDFEEVMDTPRNIKP